MLEEACRLCRHVRIGNSCCCCSALHGHDRQMLLCGALNVQYFPTKEGQTLLHVQMSSSLPVDQRNTSFGPRSSTAFLITFPVLRRGHAFPMIVTYRNAVFQTNMQHMHVSVRKCSGRLLHNCCIYRCEPYALALPVFAKRSYFRKCASRTLSIGSMFGLTISSHSCSVCVG